MSWSRYRSAADWRGWLGVPEDWYVDHRFDAEGRTLVVDVADGSTVNCVVLVPSGTSLARGPVVVVPAYRAETAAGDVAGRRAFAAQLSARGVVAIAVSWWFESMVDPEADGLDGRYAPAVAEQRNRHTCTGLGRSTADLVAVLDALDAEGVRRVGCFGHSLGGKLAMHLAAFDERVAATAASEPGVGLAFSNWSAPWYLDGRILERDHDDLLALIPPRRFLLVAGGDADGPHNAHPLDRTDGLERLDHDEGHTPPWPVLDAAYDWLAAALDSRA